MHQHVLIAAALVCAACEPPAPAGGTTDQPDASTTRVVCEQPIEPNRACETVGDCWDSNGCSEDICDTSTPASPPDPYGRRFTCRWTARPDGALCDLPSSDGVDVCTGGRCCTAGGVL